MPCFPSEPLNMPYPISSYCLDLVASSWLIGFPTISSSRSQQALRYNSLYLINQRMVIGLNPLVETTSSKTVQWPESHTTWFMGLLLAHAQQIQANMRDNPKYVSFFSRSIYHTSQVISQHLMVVVPMTDLTISKQRAPRTDL